MTGVAGVEVGDVLAGKYQIEKILGMGGMGVVVAARHLQLEERVAIKFLLPEMLEHPDAVSRFAREARAAVKIKSEHVARVTDVGVLETGAPYMVMEYLEGIDLAAWMRKHGRLAIDQAVELLLQACEAIAEAHAIGIVHRDLKPANLFVIRRADGLLSLKVLDFGISKVTNTAPGAPMSMTSTTTVMGSPLYMCPEQMQSSRDVDGRADIWALGIILYEMLTDKVPFQGDTLPEVCFKIATAPPQPLRAVRPDAPPRLEAVIFKCLEKDREVRFRNVAELATALAPFGPPRSRTAVERIARTIRNANRGSAPELSPDGTTSLSHDSGRADAGDSGTMNPWDHGTDGAPRTSSRTVVYAAVAIVFAGALAFFVLRNDRKDSQADATVRERPVQPSPAAATPAEPAVAPVAPALPAPPAPSAVDDRLTPPTPRAEPAQASPHGKAPVRPTPAAKQAEKPAPVHPAPPHSAAPEPPKPPGDLGGRI